MSKNAKSVQISTCFGLSLSLVLLAGAVVTIVLIHIEMRHQALVAARSKARLLLNQNLATHAYFTNQLKPKLFETTKSSESPEHFDPTWMSSTYAVRHIAQYREPTDEVDYYYRECAVNARSPENEADEVEREFLQQLNADAAVLEKEAIRSIGGASCFTVMRRGETMERSCLRCHSTPEKAPAELVQQYGPSRSFHRKVGEVVSAVSIRIPISEAYAEANRLSFRLSAVFLAIITGVFLTQHWLAKRLVFAPLARLRDKTQEIATDDTHLGESLAPPRGKELQELANSFNRMSASLKDGRDHLEERVAARTEELAQANEMLQKEIGERRQAEKTLQESESRLREAQEMAHLGYWFWDVKTGDVEWSEEVYRIFRLEPDRFTPQVDSILDLSPWPEDRHRDKELIQRARESREPGSYEQRFLRPDGSTGHYCSTFQGVYDDDGALTAIKGTVQDITERKQAESERERLTAELRAQNAELERFNYTVSHDLRSPLVTIKGFVDMAHEDLAEGNFEQVEDELARVSNAAVKMDRLLNDLLELSRIGRSINPQEVVPLEELAHDALRLVDGRINGSGIEVTISPNLPVVFGDRVRLTEVFQNLIDNAVKYMGDQPDPSIEVGVRHDDGQAVCYVRDNGIGIDPRFHERVFGLFNQLNPKAEGSGVGMALAQRIVEAHGGRIWVESEGPGHGSTFCFTIAERSETPQSKRFETESVGRH